MTSGATNVSRMRRQASMPCEAKPDDPYSNFIAGMTRRAGKRGTGLTGEINEAPNALSDLPTYFASLPVGKLASCWVACLTDAVDPEEAGNMARALIVVAHRLHNVAFTTPDVPCPRQATDGEHPMPFALQSTTPPQDLKSAKRTPPHLKDAMDSIKDAPTNWRWFHWESCPTRQWKKAGKMLQRAFPNTETYLDGDKKVVVKNTTGQPRIGPAPAPAPVYQQNSYDPKPSNEPGRRAESQAPRILKILEDEGKPMTVSDIRVAMGLCMSPAAAVGLLLDQGKVVTREGPDGTTIVELASAPAAA